MSDNSPQPLPSTSPALSVPPVAQAATAPGAGPAPTAASSVADAATTSKAPLKSQLLSIGLAIALALVALLWYHTSVELNRVRDDVGRRVQQADLEQRENRLVAREAQESARESQSRVGQLENRVNESQSQQLALEQLYHELSRGRDEWLLAEVEQTIALASQQLQLAGNVQGALIALQIADARLGRSDRPQHIPLRKLINRDIDRLRALPPVDVAGLSLKLDELTRASEQLPLLADGRPQIVHDELAEGSSVWTRLSVLVWGEIKQLVRIQRLDSSDQALLTPEQSYFLRENLKLRLMHARIALLQRNDSLYRADVTAARQWLERYFDVRQPRVAAAVATLTEISGATLDVQLPTLGESLTTIRTLKSSGDKGE